MNIRIINNTGLTTWAITAVTLVSAGLLAFTITPSIETNFAHADSVSAEMEVSVNPVASIALEYYDPSSSSYVDSDKLRLTVDPDTFKTGAMRITTSTNSPAGMKLSMNDSDSNNALIEQGDSQSSPAKPVISSITTNTTIADVTDSGKAFSDNTWGYAIADTTAGSSAAPAVPLTYSQIPTTETQLKETDTTGDSAYIFTAGVRVGRTLPAGTYKDQLTFTVIANPLPLTLYMLNGEYMQDSRLATACANTATPAAADINVPTITMVDQRDNQEYTIRKLADGNCWMGENLRYGINPDGTGHPFVAADAALSNSVNSTKMLDLTYNSSNPNTAGRIKNGTSGMKTVDNSANAFAGNTEGYTEPYINIYQANDVADYDGKTKYGVLYNYCAATGGTVCNTDAMSADAAGSICPSGWKMPGMTANLTDTTDKTYNKLLNAYSVTRSADGFAKMTAAPLSFVRSGLANNDSLIGRSATGSGYSWSSTKYTSTYRAYHLYFYSSGVSQNYNGRYSGNSLRCVSS